MFRWLLFILVLALGAASLLTFFKAPNLPLWMASVVVGEFGQWLIVFVCLLIVLVVVATPAGIVRQMTLTACVITVLILSRPTLQGWLIGQNLPTRLNRALGSIPAPLGYSPFEFDRLMDPRGPAPVEMKTEPFAFLGLPDQLSLDFYPAVSVENKLVPCVIMIHGGGWDNGDRSEFPALNNYLARHGYAVASISYRLAPKFRWPAQREDVLNAISFLKENAESHGIDPNRLILMGRSAGGNLAEAVGYAAKDKAIRGIVAFYSPADLNFAWLYGREDDVLKSPDLLRQFLGGTPKTAKTAYDETSAYDQVTRETPPTLLIHGVMDSLVWFKQSDRLEVRLSKNNVPHFFLSLPWATHAFDYNFHGPSGQLSTYALEYFLAAVSKEGGLPPPKPAPSPPPEPVKSKSNRSPRTTPTTAPKPTTSPVKK